MSNENVSFKYSLEPTFGNIPTKVRKDSAYVCNTVLQDSGVMRYLEKLVSLKIYNLLT